MKFPTGFDAIVKFYTLPTRDNNGMVTQEWKTKNLVTISVPFCLSLSWAPETLVTHITCHKLFSGPLLVALNDIKAANLAVYLGADYGGCYMDRAIRGASGHISMHAFGAAIDFRVKENPLGSEHPEIIMRDKVAPIFKSNGFMWGGDFQGRKDPEHFQGGFGY